MEESKASQSSFLEGELVGIRFGLATHKEICTASINDCPISHSSQLTNPFLGLPLEFGKCESCGTSEPGKCEGHFGYIELPIPIYHPSHIGELKHLLSLICLKCLILKKNKFAVKNSGVAERLLSCCPECSLISIRDAKTSDGACFLELKLPSRLKLRDGFWNFLERYGFRYGDGYRRTLLPCEVLEILKRIPGETRKKLEGKGYFPQDGYIIRYLPVPPNCLSVPDVSDGFSVMSSDVSISMLKKVLKQVEIIKNSRSGAPNFESHEVEANDLQLAVDRYLQVRGTNKSARDVEPRYGVNKELNESSTKAWLEKMRTLFIRKGCGFSSRSVITGDSYQQVTEIGIPYEIAQRITFEERVNVHNIRYLQELVDNKLCLTYRDGSSTYSLREGSKGHTFVRLGQVVHRRILDGDVVFINRPPTTHKHSLQALSVYIHEDHTVKINPIVCGPLSADFDGDCIHLFYPQSLAAKAEVLELFSVEKQLLSSHSGNLNLQLPKDSLLSLKMMFKLYFLDRSSAQQLAMFVSPCLPPPALLKIGPYWTALQILQTVLPACFDCSGDRFLIRRSEILKVDCDMDAVSSMVNDFLISIFFEKGSGEVLKFFNSLQPLLMENLFSEGFSVCLEDFSITRSVKESIQENFKVVSPLLCNLRSTYNELVALQLDNHILHSKQPVVKFIISSSALGHLIDSKSDSAVTKVVQQIGFLGLQISDRGKFYSKTLIEDLASLFVCKYPSDVVDYPSAQYGLIKSCFFHGLDPYEEIVHSISTREVMVRSSRGLSEPGTLFKNLMAILRDVVICYDGTVRNICSNTIIQFEYGVNAGPKSQSLFPAGEPVGVLAATAMSNPAYKAVLDSTPSSNNSWELMKEILLCKVSFKNDMADRRVILYLNDCACGRNYCQEKAAYVLKNHLEKVCLKDIAKSFMIEYKGEQTVDGGVRIDTGLVGHVHLEKMKLQDLNISTEVILQKCQEKINLFQKQKKAGSLFKKINLFVSRECCSFQHSCGDKLTGMPCLMFFWQDNDDHHLERTSSILADIIFPVLLETVIRGDHRVSSANVIWVSPETTTWIRNPSRTQRGELAVDVCLEKSVVKQSGDAWRIVMDSCLPIIHLIDTTRSAPYAVKQVQELLGVSCAFDQAVQRLSTSVTMVAKGVLKEHLILLANSMTCAGNLVGFNSGGYKALCRSLDIQVPFTEATLFMPRRCFERAAEKRHIDSLSSIVAACSWGKHVAVGTGSCFDVLWDTKDACLNEKASVDMYDFLNMLGSGTRGEESATACLGAEVDELIAEHEIEDWNLSPEHDPPIDKLTFEDTDAEQNVGADKGKPWSSWGMNSAQTQNVPSRELQKESDTCTVWDTVAARRENINQNKGNGAAEPDSWSGWESDKAETRNSPATKTQEVSARSSDYGASAAWERKGEDSYAHQTSTSKSNAWWTKKLDDIPGPSKNYEQSWPHQQTGPSWENKISHDQSGWTSTVQEDDPKSSGWPTSSWENKTSHDQSGWTSTAQEDAPKSSGWRTSSCENQISQDQSGWTSTTQEDAPKSSGWPMSSCVNKISQEQSGWTSTPQEDAHKSSGWSTSSWENKISRDQSGWTSTAQEDAPKSSGWPTSSCENKISLDQSGWTSTAQEDGPKSSGWPTSSWGTPNSRGGNRGERNQQWGQQNREFKRKGFEGSRGWSSMKNDGSSGGGKYTTTRQRLDIFTSQEQDILTDVEPLMQSIRRIMHNSGYNDGDPLSATDQSYILDNVFNYHPDRAVKMGDGIDHLTVSKHSRFQDTRCFYVVSTGGSRQDFSYRKCLENFVKGKYPGLAEEFIGKYFSKHHSEANRQREPVSEGTGDENSQKSVS